VSSATQVNSTGVWLRAKEMEISAALWAIRLEKEG